MLDIAGFDVVDLGVDVQGGQTFIDTAREKARADHRHELPAHERHRLDEGDRAPRPTRPAARPTCKLMVGGAPVTEQVVAYTGADGFGKDAVEAVELARQWIGGA